MPANFPTSLDSNPSAATLAANNLDTDPHSTLHGDLGDQIEALQAKVGVDGSAVTSSHDYKIAALNTALAGYQPLDSDLTAIAALSTTAYGRAFLALANQAALMALLSASSDTAAGIVELATSAETITGTDTARAVTPAGAAAAYQPLDSDLTAIAALSTTSFGRAFLALADAAAARTAIDFDEAAQDAVGGILTDSSTVDFTYTDGTPAITAAVIADSIGPTQLADTAVTPGSYGSSSAVPAITVDAQGRITAASTNAIADSVTNLILARAYFK